MCVTQFVMSFCNSDILKQTSCLETSLLPSVSKLQRKKVWTDVHILREIKRHYQNLNPEKMHLRFKPRRKLKQMYIL
jgi:hypothetical protein